MPKINADTLEEHRSKVMKDLLDGTERILLSHGSRRLTTAAVAAEAGIARNSIYRYVHSVDDLVEMVLTRGFEEWTAQVRAAADAAPDARSAVIAYVHSNLTQAFSGQHGLQQALPDSELPPTPRSAPSENGVFRPGGGRLRHAQRQNVARVRCQCSSPYGNCAPPGAGSP